MSPEPTHDEQMLALCERFFGAVVAADLTAVRACYAPDAVSWHNTDGKEQSVDETLRTLEVLPRFVKDFRYEDARRYALPDGFVEFHTVRCSNAAGVEISIPACVVCSVIEGRIMRMEEYLDSAQ